MLGVDSGFVSVAGMTSGAYPVSWESRRAVVTLPDHIDVCSAAQSRAESLSVIDRGADELIADRPASSTDDAGPLPTSHPTLDPASRIAGTAMLILESGNGGKGEDDACTTRR